MLAFRVHGFWAIEFRLPAGVLSEVLTRKFAWVEGLGFRGVGFRVQGWSYLP